MAPPLGERAVKHLEAYRMLRRFSSSSSARYACTLALALVIGCGGPDSPDSPSPAAGGAAGGVAGTTAGGGAAGSSGGTNITAGSGHIAGASGEGGAVPIGGMGMATAGTSTSGGGGSGGTAPGTLPDPSQKKAAYVYGSVSEDGAIPAPAGQEYDQMRLTDTSELGCSEYKMEIEKLGYSITEVYDRETTFDLAFLNQYNVIIFGNHQKVMNSAEQAAIATWVTNGGGLLAYNDSALGGKYDVVGISNTVGQQAVNSIIGQFGMQVLTDQGNGTCAMKAPEEDTNPATHLDGKSLVIEGEGETPVCVDPAAGVKILIPFSSAAKVGDSGEVTTNNAGGGMTISNPLYAALAVKEQGKGRVMAQFDRQMMWNDGPGSSINQRDNRELEKRIFLYLAHEL